MKSEEKRMILIIIVIGAIIIGGLVLAKRTENKEGVGEPEKIEVKEKYVDVLEDGTKLNKSDKLNAMKKVGELEITNIQLTNANGSSVLLADVKNTGNTEVGLTEIEITLLDDTGKTLDKLDALIPPVGAGQTVQINCGVSSDYANAYDFEITKK